MLQEFREKARNLEAGLNTFLSFFAHSYFTKVLKTSRKRLSGLKNIVIFIISWSTT